MGNMYLVCYKGDDIFDSLIRILKGDAYTHVGIAMGESDTNEVTYLACRVDGGVAEYVVPKSDVDLYLIHNPRTQKVEDYFTKTKGNRGSFITDCGYRYLKDKEAMGSEEWVAQALDLGFPEKYKINDLIEFSKVL
jgi:hypothetical protein